MFSLTPKEKYIIRRKRKRQLKSIIYLFIKFICLNVIGGFLNFIIAGVRKGRKGKGEKMTRGGKKNEKEEVSKFPLV